jgi:hypothetical protein
VRLKTHAYDGTTAKGRHQYPCSALYLIGSRSIRSAICSRVLVFSVSPRALILTSRKLQRTSIIGDTPSRGAPDKATPGAGNLNSILTITTTSPPCCSTLRTSRCCSRTPDYILNSMGTCATLRRPSIRGATPSLRCLRGRARLSRAWQLHTRCSVVAD